MGVFTYKCPNCNGGLIFNPETQDFVCEYCQSHFSKMEIETKEEENFQETKENIRNEENQTVGAENNTAFYSCPSCGAEVVADATIAATHCYYCHNPVVLSDRLSGDFEPDGVIPFSVEKEEAKAGLLNWMKSKWFIPKDFYCKKQIEMINGVYFPTWFIDCKVQADLAARATKVRSWQNRKFRFTETRNFNVLRGGDVMIHNIPKKALNKEESKLYEAVLPFDIGKAEKFTSAYLSGFQAEKRNIEKKDLQDETASDVQKYATTILSDTIKGYTTVAPTSCRINHLDTEWKYTLLPVWVVTYKDRNKKIYYYAMNGQTGKVNGELPVDHKKLGLVSVGISVVLCMLLLLGGYFLL